MSNESPNQPKKVTLLLLAPKSYPLLSAPHDEIEIVVSQANANYLISGNPTTEAPPPKSRINPEELIVRIQTLIECTDVSEIDKNELVHTLEILKGRENNNPS